MGIPPTVGIPISGAAAAGGAGLAGGWPVSTGMPGMPIGGIEGIMASPLSGAEPMTGPPAVEAGAVSAGAVGPE